MANTYNKLFDFSLYCFDIYSIVVCFDEDYIFIVIFTLFEVFRDKQVSFVSFLTQKSSMMKFIIFFLFLAINSSSSWIIETINPCPYCSFSTSWPYTSSTGTTDNCSCLKKGGGLYRIFLDGAPVKSCCSTVAPRCPSYSLTTVTCVPPLYLLHPWIVNNGYCCDYIVGFPWIFFQLLKINLLIKI